MKNKLKTIGALIAIVGLRTKMVKYSHNIIVELGMNLMQVVEKQK